MRIHFMTEIAVFNGVIIAIVVAKNVIVVKDWLECKFQLQI